MSGPTGKTPLASDARARILEQHAGLRRTLANAAALASDVSRGSIAAARALPPFVQGLVDQLESHLAFEEALLIPVLHQIDPWGPARAAQLAAEHRRQRATLETIGEIAAGRETDQVPLALTLHTLVAELLADMAQEEREMLSADLLRDDLVVIDQATD